jgi:hypothetical protein
LGLRLAQGEGALLAAKSGDNKNASSMPSETLLTMLRQRIVPAARDCFRKDRAGRADYRKKATFVLRLAEQEVVFARVEGDVSQELGQCLLAGIDTLDVPLFTGDISVRYPLVTEAEPLADQIALTPEVANNLDAILGPERAAESTTPAFKSIVQ